MLLFQGALTPDLFIFSQFMVVLSHAVMFTDSYEYANNIIGINL